MYGHLAGKFSSSEGFFGDKNTTLDRIQTELDVIGWIPGVGDVADGANGLISLYRKDYVSAGLDLVSMVPLIGDVIGKGGKVANRIIKHADSIIEVTKIADRNKKTIVLGENMSRVKKAAKILQNQGIDAKWYQAWSKNFPTSGIKLSEEQLSKAIKRNERMLKSKLDQGYQIIDIGIDATRKGERSVFFNAEQALLDNATDLDLIRVKDFQ